MTIDKREEIIALYDTYSKLLTDKQKSYFEEYYFDDLSITEIADNHQISRNGVYDQIKRVTAILYDYEEKLGLIKKINRIEKLDVTADFKQTVIEIIKE